MDSVLRGLNTLANQKSSCIVYYMVKGNFSWSKVAGDGEQRFLKIKECSECSLRGLMPRSIKKFM
jgi:hypothetical protein